MLFKNCAQDRDINGGDAMRQFELGNEFGLAKREYRPYKKDPLHKLYISIGYRMKKRDKRASTISEQSNHLVLFKLPASWACLQG
jgi:hypothetical protein